MVNVVLTTNVSLNGGSVDARIYEYDNDGTVLNANITGVSDGWSSQIVSGFEGKGIADKYAILFYLSHSDPTKSPVVHNGTVESPTVTQPVGVQTTSASVTPSVSQTTAESTTTVVSTASVGEPQTVLTDAQSSIGVEPSSAVASPSEVAQTYSQKTVSVQTTSASTTTSVHEYTETFSTATTTDVAATPNLSYSVVKVYSSVSTPTAVTDPTSVSIVVSRVGPYKQRINANIDYVTDSWSNNGIPFGETGRYQGGDPPNIYKLSNAVCGVLDGFDYRVNIAHANIHVPFAMGKSLDRIGNLANVKRKQGESDDRYRKRIIITMRASVTGTTYNEVAEITSDLLDTDVENVTFDFRPTEFPATLFVIVDEQDIATTPFSAEEIADLLDRVVPADHNVVLEQQGTFLFKDVGAMDQPEHGFTTTPADESVGGTLKGEIGQ